MKIVAEFEVNENHLVQVQDLENGVFQVVEFNGDETQIFQPNLDERGVIRYLSHRLHGLHHQYNKLAGK